MIDGNWHRSLFGFDSQPRLHSLDRRLPRHCCLPRRVWTHLTPKTKHHQSTEISDLTLAIRETRCLFTKQRGLNHFEQCFQMLNWFLLKHLNKKHYVVFRSNTGKTLLGKFPLILLQGISPLSLQRQPKVCSSLFPL